MFVIEGLFNIRFICILVHVKLQLPSVNKVIIVIINEQTTAKKL